MTVDIVEIITSGLITVFLVFLVPTVIIKIIKYYLGN